MGQKLFFGKGTISLTKETSYKIYVVSVEIVRVGLGQVLKCPTSEYSASCAFVMIKSYPVLFVTYYRKIFGNLLPILILMGRFMDVVSCNINPYKSIGCGVF